MKTQTSTPTLSSGRARAERCKELKEEKESNATKDGARDSQEMCENYFVKEQEGHFQRSGDRTQNHQSNRPKGRRRMEGDRRGSPAQAPRLKQGTAQASRTGQDRTCTATTNPVEGSKAPRNHSPEAGATQERAQAQRHFSIPG